MIFCHSATDSSNDSRNNLFVGLLAAIPVPPGIYAIKKNIQVGRVLILIIPFKNKSIFFISLSFYRESTSFFPKHEAGENLYMLEQMMPDTSVKTFRAKISQEPHGHSDM